MLSNKRITEMAKSDWVESIVGHDCTEVHQDMPIGKTDFALFC